MPRPALPPALRRNHIVYTSLRPAEREALGKVESASGQTLSQILREAFVAAVQRRKPSWLKSLPSSLSLNAQRSSIPTARGDGAARTVPRRKARPDADRR